MKTAVIVAAGLSSRLYPLTKDTPKSLLPLQNGELIIERHIRLLKKSGIERIIVVVGYLHEKIKTVLGNEVEYVYNPFYEKCNNMGSLWFANHSVSEPFIYIHADLVYSEKLLYQFIEDSKSSKAIIDFAIDFSEVDEEAMKVKCNEDNEYLESSKEIAFNEAAGEWIGLTYIRNPKLVFEEIEKVMNEKHLTVYDTFAFNRLAKSYSLQCHSINEESWVEVDFLEDYERAKELF